jgi:hypothetical protein
MIPPNHHIDNSINLLLQSCQEGKKDAARSFLDNTSIDVQKGICKEVCALSGRDPSNVEWAKEHALDNLQQLSLAVEHVVKNTFLRLSQERQNDTREHLYRLANVSTLGLTSSEVSPSDDIARLTSALYTAGVFQDQKSIFSLIKGNNQLIQFIQCKNMILNLITTKPEYLQWVSDSF